MLLTNYHTHCQRCQHADGSEADYVDEAIRCGFDILGMSDHVPYPRNERELRMTFGEMKNYIWTVQELAELHRDEIKILVGFESEYLPECDKYYESLLVKYGAEYLVLGQHFFNTPDGEKNSFYLQNSEDCVWYAKSVAAAMGRGYYAFVAHPDVVCINCFKWDRNMDEMTDIIINASLQYDIPLEVNANGIRRGLVDDEDGQHFMYPHYKFWEKAAEAQTKTVVSADCHSPKLLYDEDVHKAWRIAHEWGLNIIDVI